MITLEDFSVKYFAGYGARKTIEKFDCDSCKVDLCKPDSFHKVEMDELLLVFKDYSESGHILHLKRPMKTCQDIVDFVINENSTYF